MRTFSSTLSSGCASNISSICGTMSMPRHCTLIYHVWWLMPAQTMSTSSLVQRLVLADQSLGPGPQLDGTCDLLCPFCTPWHRPIVGTPPYLLHAHTFIAMGFE